MLLCLRGGEALADVHETLKEVAQKVVLNNPEVLAKWHAFKSAGGDLDLARSGLYPRVDFLGGAGREKLKLPGSPERDYTRSGYALTLNQILYDGSATINDVKRTDRARLTRYFELLDAAENAALEAGRAYYDVMRFRYLMYLAENNYVEHRASYEQLVRRAQAGAGRRVDVEHAASRLALAELNLNTEAANLHDVMARYLRLTGEKPPQVMFQSARQSRDYPPSEQEALKSAFRHNPTLRAALENVEAARYELEMRRSGFHPKVDLRLRTDRAENVDGIIGTRSNNIVELVVNYNLFSGGADVARETIYAERKNQAFDLRDKACRDVRQTISIAYNDVGRLRAQLSSLDVQVTSIERTRDAYKAQFNIGQRSLLDLLDTENELLNARRTAANTEMDLATALLRTQAGMGRLLEFLGLKRIDEKDAPDPAEMTPVVESDICPPDVPVNALVDIEELTARAMAIVDATRPVGDSILARPPSPAAATPAPSVQPPAGPAKPGAAAVPAGNVQPGSQGRAAATPASPAETAKMLAERVKAWADAWSSKAYETYAGFYAASFLPADGSSRDEWARQRAQRLAKPGAIQVEVRNFNLKEVGKDVMVTEFEQDYRSDGYSDTTRKSLRWVLTGGQWLIESETVEPRPAGAKAQRRAGK